MKYSTFFLVLFFFILFALAFHECTKKGGALDYALGIEVPNENK